MDIKNEIKNELRKIGRKVVLVDGDWKSMPFYAKIQPIRYKNKMYLQETGTPLGLNIQEYFLYIGPFDHDFTSLSSMCEVVLNDDKFTVTKREKVYYKDEMIYVWAVLRRLVE